MNANLGIGVFSATATFSKHGLNGSSGVGFGPLSLNYGSGGFNASIGYGINKGGLSLVGLNYSSSGFGFSKPSLSYGARLNIQKEDATNAPDETEGGTQKNDCIDWYYSFIIKLNQNLSSGMTKDEAFADAIESTYIENGAEAIFWTIDLLNGGPTGEAKIMSSGFSKNLPKYSEIKKAFQIVYKKLGIDGPLPKAPKSRIGSPQRELGKKGYRLDPPHRDHIKFWNIDYWWDKKKRGGYDYEPIGKN